MHTTIVRDLEALLRYEIDWKRLSRSGTGLFATWEFCMAWLRSFLAIDGRAQKIVLGDESKICYFRELRYSLETLVVEDASGTVLLIAPFIIKDIGAKILTFIGDDDFDYHGFVHDGRGEETIDVVVEHILDFLESGGSLVDLKGIGPDDELCSTLRDRLVIATGSEGLRARFAERYYATCPVLALSVFSGYEDFIAKANRTIVRLLRKSGRVMEEGGLSLSRLDDSATIMRTIDRFVGISKEYWRAKGGFSLFAIEGNVLFVKELIKAHTSVPGRCIEFTLSRRGEFLGCIIAFRFESVIYYFLPIRVDLKEINIGSVLISALAEYGFANDIEYVDFLRGSRDYKHQWGAVDKAVTRFLISKGSIENEDYALSYPFGDIIPKVSDPDGFWGDVQYYPEE